MKYDINVNKLNNEQWNTKVFVSIVFEESLKVTDITIKEAKKQNVVCGNIGIILHLEAGKTIEEISVLFSNYRYNWKKLCKECYLLCSYYEICVDDGERKI